MSADKTHIIEVRQPSGTAVYVTELHRDGGISTRADKAKARRMSEQQAAGAMHLVKRALSQTPAVAYVVRA